MNLGINKIGINEIYLIVFAFSLIIDIVLVTILASVGTKKRRLKKNLEDINYKYDILVEDSQEFILSLKEIIAKYGTVKDKVKFINYLHKYEMRMNNIEILFESHKDEKKNNITNFTSTIPTLPKNININKEALIPDEELHMESNQ